MPEGAVCVGIAVAKAHFDIARRPTVEGGRVAHEDAGSGPVVARRQALQPARIVLEATGGLEVSVTAAVTAAGWPVVVVTPRHARDVAKATGRRAKTEALDAHRRAHVGAAVRPAPRPLPEAPTPALSAHLARRRPRLDRLTAEKNRLGRAPPMIQADIQAPITWLERRRADLTDDLGSAIRASAVGRAHDDRLQSTPGVGPVLASTLVVDLPAWGTWSRQPIAALVGVAPLNRDSGPLRGNRTVWGGRAHGRAVLSMSTRVAVRYHPLRHTVYERLRRAGKAPTVALTACLRMLLTMLNAMRTHRTPWQQNYAPALDN
jgi:transposase